jgi:hypothetical protein
MQARLNCRNVSYPNQEDEEDLENVSDIP